MDPSHHTHPLTQKTRRRNLSARLPWGADSELSGTARDPRARHLPRWLEKGVGSRRWGGAGRARWRLDFAEENEEL
jgi:hypothetical protein